MSSEQITKDMQIVQAIRICPTAAEVFERYGMGCMGCMASSSETIEQGALMHGIDVEAILRDLNNACEA